MNKVIINFSLVAGVLISLTACLKSTKYYEDFSSIQPIADLPKAPVNAITAAAPTNSLTLLDSLPAGVDYLTAVHLSAKDHVGDVTIRMKIDTAAAGIWLRSHASLGFRLLPDSLYTVPSLDVKITNAGVFAVGDFPVRIKTGVRDPATGTPTVPGKSIFKSYKFILPVSIDTVLNTTYGVANNYRTILWYIRVK